MSLWKITISNVTGAGSSVAAVVVWKEKNAAQGALEYARSLAEELSPGQRDMSFCIEEEKPAA